MSATNHSPKDHSNDRGDRPHFATCGNCGGYPLGIGCYHICYNSVYYYTLEQERYDDQFYGDDDDRERYAATIEADQYADADDQEAEIQAGMQTPDPLADVVSPDGWRRDYRPLAVIDTDDIPF